jgi:hypothetical protein
MRTTEIIAEAQECNVVAHIDWRIGWERGDRSVGEGGLVLETPVMQFPVILEINKLRLPLTEAQVVAMCSTSMMDDWHERAVEQAYETEEAPSVYDLIGEDA